ncbi:MAG: aquaporin [Bryobacteraceae bacterium]
MAKLHWTEYLMEAGELAAFMVSACMFGVVLGHPASPVPGIVPDPTLRRVLMGMAMGLTAVAIIRSPWGQRSGAHLNPATTLTFYVLGKVERRDAVLYAAAQFLGAVSGVALSALVLGRFVADVNFVATTPGDFGTGAAFAAEVAMTFVLMSVVLRVSNDRRWAAYTPYFAGALVALFISVEAPVSGMSMNPARTFGSAVWAQAWQAIWIYFTAPPLGMLAAAFVYRELPGARRVFCAKLHHHNDKPCIFRCQFGEIS